MTAKFGMLISAKTTGANDIKRLGNSMQGVQGKAKNLGNAVKGVGLAFKAMFAAAAIGGIAAFAKSSIDAADALGKLEVRTGIAAAKLQSYVNAGKLADVSQKQLATGLKTLARTQLEAADGVATYADAYNKLGVSVKNSDGTIKQSDQLLGEIADTFATLPDGPEKTAIALDIFGKSGADMITMLNGGKAALEEFNFQLSDKFAQNAEYYNDQITKMQFGFDAFRMQMMDSLMPALIQITEAFATLFDTETDWSSLFLIIEAGIRTVAGVTFATVAALKFFGRTLVDLVKIAERLVNFDVQGALGVARQGLADTKDQFFQDIDQFAGIFSRSSEAPDSYGRRTGGVLLPDGDQDSTLEQSTNKTSNNVKEMSVDLAIFLADLEASVAAADQLEAEQFAAGAAIAEQLNKQDEMNNKLTETEKLFESIKDTVATGLTNAIEGLIDGTKSLGDSLSGVLRQMASLFLRAGIGSFGSGGEPGTGLLGLFAKGGVFAQNNVVPFAYGGVVNKPTLFPMANGMGLMGEAGAEAIMPLRRGRGGRLGVEAAGGGATNVNVSVDASGSSVQGDGPNASQLGKAIGAAVQAELIKQKRPGGLLTR